MLSQDRLELLTTIDIKISTEINDIIQLGLLLHRHPEARKQLIAINDVYNAFKLKKYRAFVCQELDNELSITIPYPIDLKDEFITITGIKPNKLLLAKNHYAPSVTCDLAFCRQIVLKPYQIPELISLIAPLESLWQINEAEAERFWNEDETKLTFTSFKNWLNAQLATAKKGA